MTLTARIGRYALPAFLGLLATSCATTDPAVGAASGPVVADAPQYRVGDRWVYRIREGFRNPVVYEETRTVTDVSNGAATVRIASKGPTFDVQRVEVWPAPGLVAQGTLFDIETRKFATPVQRYRFPLKPGDRWGQFVQNYNDQLGRTGVINHHVRVEGTDRVTTPAGSYDAVRMRVIMHLDDEEFWRYGTDTNYVVWYAPAVKASVREVKRADYLEKGGGPDAGGRLPTQNALVELVSFTPGA